MTPMFIISAVVLLLADMARGAATNDTWNYNQHGLDWNFDHCNVTSSVCD